MKLTSKQLRKIIKEEYRRVVHENYEVELKSGVFLIGNAARAFDDARVCMQKAHYGVEAKLIESLDRFATGVYENNEAKRLGAWDGIEKTLQAHSPGTLKHSIMHQLASLQTLVRKQVDQEDSRF